MERATKCEESEENATEIECKKICLKLINEMKISPIYDREKDTTTFQLTFPIWLKKNYSEETVEQIIKFITPILTQGTNDYTNKGCLQVIKENV